MKPNDTKKYSLAQYDVQGPKRLGKIISTDSDTFFDTIIQISNRDGWDKYVFKIMMRDVAIIEIGQFGEFSGVSVENEENKRLAKMVPALQAKVIELTKNINEEISQFIQKQ